MVELKPLTILAIDPGPSTGIAYFEKGVLKEIKTYSKDELALIITSDYAYRPFDYIVIEEFRLLPSKAKALSHDRMIVPEIIGSLKTWFGDKKIVTQPSSVANGKRFFTVERLKSMGYKWKTMHERDAICHALYFLTFGKADKAGGRKLDKTCK